MEINPKNLAYHLTSSKTKPNKIMRDKILPFFLDNNIRTVLDYGCGKHLRDSIYLSKNNLIVDAVDLEVQIQKINPEKAKLVNCISTDLVQNNYDAALLNFVLQVLPTEKHRGKVLEKVYKGIKEDGYLVLSLRNQRDIDHCVKNKGIPFNDGFIMQKGRYSTFVRGYEKAEIEELLDKYNLNILNITRTCDSFIALSQKKQS